MYRIQKFLIAVGFAAMSFVCLPVTAGAAGCYTGCTPPTVSSTLVTPPSTSGGPSAKATVTVPNGSSGLPFTGADIIGMSLVGAGAVVVGGLLVRRRRSESD